jgi:hypothetical protein
MCALLRLQEDQFMKIKRVVHGIIGGLIGLSTLPALALPTYTNGSFAIGCGTGCITTTTNVTTTTSFVYTGTMGTGGGIGDWALFGAPALPTNVHPPGSPLDFGAAASSFNWSDANAGTFAASTIVLLSTTGFPTASAAWGVKGTFTTGAGWANAGEIFTAFETFSLTQSGNAGSAISLSGTFQAPQAGVDEPSTVALMGLGCLVAGAIGRRKLKAAKSGKAVSA